MTTPIGCFEETLCTWLGLSVVFRIGRSRGVPVSPCSPTTMTGSTVRQVALLGCADRVSSLEGCSVAHFPAECCYSGAWYELACQIEVFVIIHIVQRTYRGIVFGFQAIKHDCVRIYFGYVEIDLSKNDNGTLIETCPIVTRINIDRHYSRRAERQ